MERLKTESFHLACLNGFNGLFTPLVTIYKNVIYIFSGQFPAGADVEIAMFRRNDKVGMW